MMAGENATRTQIRLSSTLYGRIKSLSEVSGANINSTMCFLMTLGLGMFDKHDLNVATCEDSAKSADVAPE